LPSRSLAPRLAGMNALTRLWRALTASDSASSSAPATVPAVIEANDGIPWDRLIAVLGSDNKPERAAYKVPEVLKGVRPETPPTGDKLKLAMDSGYTEPEHMTYDNALPAAWGYSGVGALGPGLAFLGFPYLAELNQISEYRIPSESLSTEMTRAWVKIINKGDSAENKADKIKQIEERLEALKVRDAFRESALKTEQFGRSHIMAVIDGQEDDATRQLPLTEIEKGSLKYFACIEPYWLTPYSWNSTHPERPDFYRPQSWYVLGRKTHSTRLMTFIFREVPDLLKPAYDFAGISMTQLMMPYVQRWLRTAKNVNDLINIFSVVTLATDLQALLQDPAKFIKRLVTFTQTRDNRGMMVTNKGTEELTMQNVPLGSLDKLQAQAQEHMATPGRMPLIKFFGITPSGLSTTSDGEFQAWYDYVHALQELGFSPHFEVVLKLVQMDLFGDVDDSISFEWQSLYEPTPKEESELRKADADRDTAYINASVVSADEIRERLQRDPKSGYNNLKGSAPEPPEMTEFTLGEAGKETDHARGEESAEAAHKRAKELKDAQDAADTANAALDSLRRQAMDSARRRGVRYPDRPKT
jgi:phage-related protein (TIGR01555 family)